MARTLFQLINDLNYEEQYIFAAFCVFHDKGAVLEDLQKYIDARCENYSKKFIEQNLELFEDYNFRSTFLRELDKRGANLDRSKRLLSQVYKDLKNFPEKEIEEKE